MKKLPRARVYEAILSDITASAEGEKGTEENEDTHKKSGEKATCIHILLSVSIFMAGRGARAHRNRLFTYGKFVCCPNDGGARADKLNRIIARA